MSSPEFNRSHFAAFDRMEFMQILCGVAKVKSDAHWDIEILSTIFGTELILLTMKLNMP